MERGISIREVWFRALVSLITGISIFVAIAAVALFLQFLTDYVTELGRLPAFAESILDLTPATVFGMDILLFIVFLLRIFYSTILELKERLPGKRKGEKNE